MSENPYMYLFIREDLSIPQQIVQTAHAVDELGKRIKSSANTNFMCLFGVKDESSLQMISEKLNQQGIDHEMFYEPDIAAFTAIATRPLVGEERKIMKKYKLKR